MKSAQLGVEDIDCRRCTGTRELENDNSPTQATNQAISDTLLPLELQDYIIDCLAVRRFSPAGYNRYDTEITSALAACTLVCSYWTLRSSKYFLEYINLVEFTDVIDDPLGDFLDDAQQSERLSRNVTMLQLPYKPHDICFHTLFGSLPNLSSLTTTPHWRSGRTFIHSKRRAHPQSSARYYALDKLKLLRLHTPSVLHALHYLSNLRHLELVSCYLYAFEEHVERTEHLHLTSLHLNPKDIHFLANLDPLLAPGSLKYLRFSGRTPFMSGELQYNPNKLDGFLLGAGSSLEELSIVWEHPCMWASDGRKYSNVVRIFSLSSLPCLNIQSRVHLNAFDRFRYMLAPGFA